MKKNRPERIYKRESRKRDRYKDFVEHPRYGRGPIFTDLNVSPGALRFGGWFENDPEFLAILNETAARLASKQSHHRAIQYQRESEYSPRPIDGTAVAADLSKQTPATMPMCYYFDLVRRCCDCQRQFIFFAQEQKFWYEELGFPLEAQAVRCVECRKQEQGLAFKRRRYEELFHLEPKSNTNLVEFASIALDLIEQSVFTSHQFETVRATINRLHRSDAQANGVSVEALKRRLADLVASHSGAKPNQ